MARLRQIALATAPVHEDAKLRRRTSSETEAFMAYLAGTLELPHPPNFLKSTLTVRQRAVIEQFHETHLEVTLTAAVPPQVRLRRSMTQATLFRELHDANKDFLNGHELVCSLQRDVKQLYFDGRHTLYFVFQSRRLANRYQEIALRLQRVAIELENAEQQEAGIFFAPQLRRRYSLRILGAERQLTEDRPESPLQGSDGLTGHPTDSLRDVEMAEETEEAVDTPVSDYIGSSAPSHTNTPGSDRVVYLHKVGPTAKPVQAGYWLSWFEGKEVKVPDNGQCALLALYATVTNHSDRELVLTADIKRDVGRHKRAIYALLVSNLRADCALGVVDPSAEVARLYPDAELPQSQAVAMAFLCTHMLQERQRPVDAQVPGSF
eukprot:jgi/Phyca11/114672/e_gw1.27.278.1